MPPVAVALSLFGTLLATPQPGHPLYTALRSLSLPATQQRQAWKDLVRGRPTTRLDAEQQAHLSRQLTETLPCLALYQDVLPAIERLRGAQIQVAVVEELCPDLLPVMANLPPLDAWILSCQLGHAAGEPEYYRALPTLLGVPPERVLMVGPRWREDVEWPRRHGLRSLQLDRSGQLRSDDAVHDLMQLCEHLHC